MKQAFIKQCENCCESFMVTRNHGGSKQRFCSKKCRQKVGARTSYERHRKHRIAKVCSYQKKHPEQRKSNQARYEKRHPELIIARRKSYRERHSEQIRIRDKERRKQRLALQSPRMLTCVVCENQFIYEARFRRPPKTCSPVCKKIHQLRLATENRKRNREVLSQYNKQMRAIVRMAKNIGLIKPGDFK